MRTNKYSFIKEDARWLPLDEAILAVRKCLHLFITALEKNKAYLVGETSVPAGAGTLMSQLFAKVCNNECQAFEDLCDRVKECAPGEIDEERVNGILKLGTFLAEEAEDVLPDDDSSCNDLRNAMTALYSLACNTSSKMARTAFENKVEATRKSICEGFRSLSNGFRKIERRRERGAVGKASMEVDLSPASVDRLAAIQRKSADALSARLDETEATTRSEAAELRHEIGCIRKGGRAKKKWGIEEQKACHKIWESNKHNPYIKEQIDHGGRIQRPDVFAHCKRELAKYRVETAEEFVQILEQYRKRRKQS